jgi:hypothetical protein
VDPNFDPDELKAMQDRLEKLQSPPHSYMSNGFAISTTAVAAGWFVPAFRGGWQHEEFDLAQDCLALSLA